MTGTRRRTRRAPARVVTEAEAAASADIVTIVTIVTSESSGTVAAKAGAAAPGGVEEPARKDRHERSLGRRAWRTTLLLALTLSLAAVAALGVGAVMRWSLRTPSVGDEASAVCAYLRSGDYDALAGEMDPAPDGASTGPFDRAAFAAALRALDARDGRVTGCALRQMEPETGAQVVIFSVTVNRAHLSFPLGALVVVRREADGHWLLSRASTFYYTLG